MHRQTFLNRTLSALSLVLLTIATAAQAAEDWPKTLTIGYQKYGTLIVLKSRGDLEKRLQAHGVEVKWAEFPAGAPIVEAMNAGSVDFGITGETPPVFAQAVPDSRVRYVAFEPAAPSGEAIVVKPDSPLHSLADLKGKTVGTTKGSNAYYLLIRALASVGLTLDDIKLASLKPADANAALLQGSIDAWAIWDYYFAAAQKHSGARVITTGQGLVDNQAFFLATADYLKQYAPVVQIVVEEVAKVDDWAAKNPEEAAKLLSQQVGIDAAVLEVALRRSGFGPKPLTPAAIAAQQRIADTLFELKVLPRAIVVKEAVWTPNGAPQLAEASR